MCSDFLAENTRQAAALKTDCSRCKSCPEIPERTELQYSTFVTTSACTRRYLSANDAHCEFDEVLQNTL